MVKSIYKNTDPSLPPLSYPCVWIVDRVSGGRVGDREIMAGGENGRVEEEKEVRAPLLAAVRRVPRKNSVNSMRGEFVARLPEKVKHGVDPERPFTIDVSRTRDLLEGSGRPLKIPSCVSFSFSSLRFRFLFLTCDFPVIHLVSFHFFHLLWNKSSHFSSSPSEPIRSLRLIG